MKRAGWEDVANCRAMVDAATDSVLMAWGRLMSSGLRSAGGYPKVSAGFSDCGGLSDFDDLADEVEQHIGSVAMVIVYGHRGAGGLEEVHRRPLVAVYAGGAWSGSGDFSVAFLEAVEKFERKCREKGIL
jgi:hypothetical protein